jgi:hypothetical protein
MGWREYYVNYRFAMEKKIIRQAIGDAVDMNERTIDFDHLA